MAGGRPPPNIPPKALWWLIRQPFPYGFSTGVMGHILARAPAIFASSAHRVFRKAEDIEADHLRSPSMDTRRGRPFNIETASGRCVLADAGGDRHLSGGTTFSDTRRALFGRADGIGLRGFPPPDDGKSEWWLPVYLDGHNFSRASSLMNPPAHDAAHGALLITEIPAPVGGSMLLIGDPIPRAGFEPLP